MIGIYLVTNTINGHQYVGQSVNIKRRWMEHKCPSSILNNRLINHAYRKYGTNAFKYEVIEECSEEQLDERERFWIAKLHPAYNMNEGGVGNKGHHQSEEVKKILAVKAKAQWGNKSEKEKEMIISHNLKGPRKGHPVSEETREKLRKANLGMKLSEETKRKISLSNKGKNDNKGHYKTIVACKDDGLIIGVFFGVKFAEEYFGIAKGSISRTLKGRSIHTHDYCWKYWSVETMADECKPVGVGLSHIEVRGIRKDEEIVQTTKIANSWVFDKGLIELAERSGQFKNIIDEVVYEGQLVSKNKFTGEYVFDEDARKSDVVIGYMARMDLTNGFSKTIFWTIDEVKAHATKFSQAFRAGRNSPWATDFDAMARKTVLKALFAKYAPKSVAIQQAVKFDQAVVRPNDSLTDADLQIDSFETEYVDNESIAEVATEEVAPSKGLFPDDLPEHSEEETKKGKK